MSNVGKGEQYTRMTSRNAKFNEHPVFPYVVPFPTMADMIQTYGVVAVALGTAAFLWYRRSPTYALHGYQADYLGASIDCPASHPPLSPLSCLCLETLAKAQGLGSAAGALQHIVVRAGRPSSLFRFYLPNPHFLAT